MLFTIYTTKGRIIKEHATKEEALEALVKGLTIDCLHFTVLIKAEKESEK